MMRAKVKRCEEMPLYCHTNVVDEARQIAGVFGRQTVFYFILIQGCTHSSCWPGTHYGLQFGLEFVADLPQSPKI